MGLFDLFTFKGQITDLFSATNIRSIFDKAKTTIIEQVKEKYPGKEKMAVVEIAVSNAISNKAAGCTNKLVLWVVNLILKNVPVITQAIYDYLKEKVENL